MRSLTVTLWCLTIGCRDDGDDGFLVTPQGYRLRYTDAGLVATGRATLDDVYAWHAAEVEAQAALMAEPDRARTRAREVAWDVIDGHSFVVDGTWAVGAWYPWVNTIKIALWSHAVGAVVPPEAPPWTVRVHAYDSTLYVWGVMPPRFPALRHELEHALYGQTH